MRVTKQYDFTDVVVRCEFDCGCAGDFDSPTEVQCGANCDRHGREMRATTGGDAAVRAQMVAARDAYVRERQEAQQLTDQARELADVAGAHVGDADAALKHLEELGRPFDETQRQLVHETRRALSMISNSLLLLHATVAVEPNVRGPAAVSAAEFDAGRAASAAVERGRVERLGATVRDQQELGVPAEKPAEHERCDQCDELLSEFGCTRTACAHDAALAAARANESR